MKDVSYRHILKPGTPEHGATEHGAPKNNRIRNTGGTAKHLGKVEEQRNTPEHQQNTPEYQRNAKVTPLEHPGTTESYLTKNNCSVF